MTRKLHAQVIQPPYKRLLTGKRVRGKKKGTAAMMDSFLTLLILKYLTPFLGNEWEDRKRQWDKRIRMEQNNCVDSYV
jgi:hypothetical protein